MTLRKAEFSVTIDALRKGSDDVRLSGYVATRGAQLVAVEVDRSQARGGPFVNFTLSEVIDVEDEDWNGSDETEMLGRQLTFISPAHIEASMSPSEVEQVSRFYPRRLAIGEQFGAPTQDERVGFILIEEPVVRCEVNGATLNDVYTVTMFYETAGDIRF